MPKILIITTLTNWTNRLKAICAEEAPTIFVVQANNLMDGYSKAEEGEFDLVIVASEFVALPEFEMMIILFDALGVRWLTLDTHLLNLPAQDTNSTDDPMGDLFRLDTFDRLERTIHQIKTLIRPRAAALKRTQVTTKSYRPFANRLILIGASTGGIDALSMILAALPSDSPPILIVQHTGEKFGAGLTELLDRKYAGKVLRAKNGMVLKPGMACLAAGQPQHMTLDAADYKKLRLVQGPHVSGHLPSVNALFCSAVPHAGNIVAGLLTGMGRDGAEGLLQLRQAGAVTFAQDKATSIVYGMPRAAWENGAAMKQIPIDRIADHILSVCSATQVSRAS